MKVARNMQLDASRDWEFKPSLWKLIGLCSIGIVMTGASLFIALVASQMETRGIAEFLITNLLGCVGIIFFGFCTVVSFRQLTSLEKSKLFVTSSGIKDLRISSDEISWSSIHSMSLAEVRGQRFMLLAIDPAVEARMKLTRLAKWSRGPNKLLGFDGLCVSATGLDVEFDPLFALVREHMSRR